MKDQNNKNFWQRTAFLYSFFMKKNDKTFDEISGILRPYLQADFRVLELACGTGQLTFRLCNEAGSWLATDFSSNMLERAQKHGSAPGLSFQQADATALPFENRSFDAVVISNCLHIMPRPDLALEEIKRVLKPSGYLLAPTFVYEPGYSKARIGLLERIGFETYNHWSVQGYVEYIETHGFCTEDSMLIQGSPASECVYIGRIAATVNAEER